MKNAWIRICFVEWLLRVIFTYKMQQYEIAEERVAHKEI